MLRSGNKVTLNSLCVDCSAIVCFRPSVCLHCENGWICPVQLRLWHHRWKNSWWSIPWLTVPQPLFFLALIVRSNEVEVVSCLHCLLGSAQPSVWDLMYNSWFYPHEESAHTATPLSAHSFHSHMWRWRNVACRFCAVISFKHDEFSSCQFVCWVCGMIAQEWLTNPKWNSLIGVKIN